jgi:hypothetical protein
MAIQDTYATGFAKGFPGMVANGETSNRISRTCEDAGGISFGAFVSRGAGDHGCTAVTAAKPAVLGVAIVEHGVQPLPGGIAADAYPQYESVPIMTQGAVLVTVVGAVADGDALTVGVGADAADGVGNTAADATHLATGWQADETVTDGLCRVVRR